MKHLGALLFTIAALVGVSWAATEKFGDRELFTSPPDAVSEGFVREIIMERYEQARSYLLDPESVGEDDLRPLHEAIEETVGEPDRFESEAISHDANRAEATVSVESEKASYTVSLSLAWKNGGWKLLSVPSVFSVVNKSTTENTESPENPR